MATNQSTLTLYGVNIKILDNIENKTEEYIKLLQLMYESDLHEKIRGPKSGKITNFNLTKDYDKDLYWGKFTTFTMIEKNNWLDDKSKEIVRNEDIQDGMYPNAKVAMFYFIPSIHRIFIKKNFGVTIDDFMIYLKKIITRLNDKYTIEIIKEQSNDSIDKILNSKNVLRIELEISYTNDDFADDFSTHADEYLKENKITKLHSVYTSEVEHKLNIKDKLIQGLLKLSKSNGYAIATIYNENNKKEKIKTKDYPMEYKIESSKHDSSFQLVYTKLKSLFPRKE